MATFIQMSELAFSAPGSYLTLTAPSGAARLRYATCARRAVSPRWFPQVSTELFDLALTSGGREHAYTWIAQPHQVELKAESGGRALIAFADEETLLVELEGVDLQFIPCKINHAHWFSRPDLATVIDSFAQGFHQFRAASGGTVRVVSDDRVRWLNNTGRRIDLSAPGGAFRFVQVERPWEGALSSVGVAAAAQAAAFDSWLARMPVVEDRYRQEAERAWFMIWSSRVRPVGGLTRDALYMSKFFMSGVWSWDNCFNSLATAKADPALAWNQLLLFFDQQDCGGMIPEFVSDLNAIFSFTRPPLYGWTAMKMARRIGLEASKPYLRELYVPFGKLADWWFRMRDFDGDGVCQYHEGSDAGWDNCTAFIGGDSLEAADLSTHIVLHLESLAEIATLLGLETESKEWKRRAEKQLADLLAHSVRDGRFVSPVSGTHVVNECHSLINYTPILLGHRLPAELRARLVSDLSPGGPFLTEHGLATESPSSPRYEADGYWRGPIWAPPTYFIFDGLLDAGETELARKIARQYCETCLRSPGFWENFNSQTGEGLRCPGYSWTAAVFLLLAEWLAADRKENSL